MLLVQDLPSFQLRQKQLEVDLEPFLLHLSLSSFATSQRDKQFQQNISIQAFQNQSISH